MSEKFKIITLDTVESTELSWLLYSFIAFGKVTIIEGDPGCGKTTYALRLIAHLSRGQLLTYEGIQEGLEPINIIYQTAEDGLSDTIVPRLVEAGANRTRIHVIDETEYSLSMLDKRIEPAIRETNAKMLVLDPLQAYISSNVDIHRANETREVLKQIGSVAERTGCAIILIRHLAKSSGGKAIYRGLGSIDFVGAARSVLLIGEDPNNQDIRAIVQTKNNLASKGDSMAFRINENGFEWIGAYNITADEIQSGLSTGDKHDQAESLIKKLLNENGKSVPAAKMIIEAKAIGISKRTMENVKQELGIKSVRIGDSWHWQL